MSTGEPYWCFGYRFGKQLSCITDANYVPPETLDKMRNSDMLIVDCLRGQSVKIFSFTFNPKQIYSNDNMVST
jgi:hypothetical protein